MSDFKGEFKPQKDSGRLMASQSKLNEKSPDYWGEIVIDTKDMTKVEKTPEGYLIFKISGWKTKSKTSGTTYLSLRVNRYVGENTPANDEEDVPF